MIKLFIKAWEVVRINVFCGGCRLDSGLSVLLYVILRSCTEANSIEGSYERLGQTSGKIEDAHPWTLSPWNAVTIM